MCNCNKGNKLNGKNEIGTWIRILNLSIKRHLDNSAASKYLNGLTGNNILLIGHLGIQADLGNDVYQKDIEEEFGITRSAVSKAVKLLEQKGLIERESVGGDARLKKLVLTPKAEKLTDSMRKDAANTEHILAKGFTEEELANLKDYLARLYANIESGLE